MHGQKNDFQKYSKMQNKTYEHMLQGFLAVQTKNYIEHLTRRYFSGIFAPDNSLQQGGG